MKLRDLRVDAPAIVLSTLLLVTTSAAGTEPPLPAAALPERGGDTLEGITLGESFRAVDARIDFANILPFQEGQNRKAYRYFREIERDRQQLVDGVQRIRELEVVFEDDVVVEIRSSYRSNARYNRMGPILLERFGDPVSVRAGPPRKLPETPTPEEPGDSDTPPEPVYRTQEVRFEQPRYVWIEKWVWEWEDVTLVIIGEHYTVSSKQVEQGQHIFHARLASRQSR